MNPQCVFRKLLVNIEMMVFIFSESELLITEWKIMSSNPYLSIFPNKVPSFLKKFLGALSKYLVRLKLLQKLCNSSNQLGSKHHSLSETHLVSSLACTQPITIQCGGQPDCHTVFIWLGHGLLEFYQSNSSSPWLTLVCAKEKAKCP